MNEAQLTLDQREAYQSMPHELKEVFWQFSAGVQKATLEYLIYLRELIRLADRLWAAIERDGIGRVDEF